jgi:hypothetical protein
MKEDVSKTRTRVLLEKPIVAQLVKNSSLFLEPEGSLSYSKEPITGLCPEPDEVIPH